MPIPMGRPSTTSRWRAPSAGKRSLRPTHQQRGPRSHNRERGPLMLGHPTVHRYIWVIDSTGIPFILECGQSTPAGHVPKHSNLTGGMPASMGGELWFETRCSLFLSGGSGRYPPRNEQQLADAATMFEDYGYGITYNTGTCGPAGTAPSRPRSAASIRSHWIHSGVSGRGSSASP